MLGIAIAIVVAIAASYGAALFPLGLAILIEPGIARSMMMDWD